jgi:hypothetical protein
MSMLPYALTVAKLLLGFGVLTFATLRAAEPSVANDKAANAKARVAAAQKVYQGILDRAKIDPHAGLDPERLYQWSRRWMEAEFDLSDKQEDRIAVAEAHLERMKKTEAHLKELFEKKLVSPVEAAAQTFFRLEAEQRLVQVKGK